MKKLFIAIFAGLPLFASAQNTDTLSVMSYNLLNFPAESATRIADLEVILQEALPDILVVCELTSASGANAVLNDALNQNGITYYQKANYVVGPDTQNMLYYNADKLELKEQNEITTTLRDINEYVLYFKSDDIATTNDTTFFYVYMCHLKASQGYESERNTEAQAMKNYMATRPGIENIIIGGDFNLYGSSEPAWNTILNGAGVAIVDPINTPGEWHTDWGYADIHTQSTRTTSFDGGASGGMDDRFDFIFMSPDLMNWGHQAKMVDGSYWAYGQDGNHYNDNINAAPANTSLPSNVVEALYNMSDHLPVYAEIAVQKAFNGIIDRESGVKAFYNRQSQKVHFELKDPVIQLGTIIVYDLRGKKVLEVDQLSEDLKVDVSLLEKGLYVVRAEGYNFSMKFVR